MKTWAIVAAASYDNWRIPCPSLENALAQVASWNDSTISDVNEYEDGRFVKRHGTYRFGVRYENAVEAMTAHVSRQS